MINLIHGTLNSQVSLALWAGITSAQMSSTTAGSHLNSSIDSYIPGNAALSLSSSSLLLLLCLCLCLFIYSGCTNTQAMVCPSRWEDNMVELALSVLHVGPWDQTQVNRLGRKCLYNEPSCQSQCGCFSINMDATGCQNLSHSTEAHRIQWCSLAIIVTKQPIWAT